MESDIMSITKKTLIAVPALSMVHTDFMSCFVNMRKGSNVLFGVTQNSLIYDARNEFALSAIDQNFERILWLDTDMTFGQDLLDQLSADMDDGKQYVSALAFTRKLPTVPSVTSGLQASPPLPPSTG